MRIIGGENKGVKLQVASKGVRPTTDFVKEKLFQTLENMGVFNADYEVTTLDLFGGSGALTFESISRGAGHGVILDSSQSSISSIKHNLLLLNSQKTKVSIYKIDALKFVSRPNNREPYDVVFIDPPFRLETSIVNNILHFLVTNNYLCEHSYIFSERERHSEAIILPPELHLLKDLSKSDILARVYEM
ncbi:MAG: RsmD family RNA methyltransferase [Bifidobacteriaceae bacterium]|jgi:16S rRNA (guanine966-N2)-methyltransferase|nr:RsmD family RNA methyltransferase [Bifidobacteriaceae bacterium]